MSSKPRGRPRSKPRTEPKALKRRSPLQIARMTAMMSADPRVTQTVIQRALEEEGIFVTRAAIGLVLSDTFDNADVQRKFCELTGTTRDSMFPGTAAERRKDARIANGEES